MCGWGGAVKKIPYLIGTLIVLFCMGFYLIFSSARRSAMFNLGRFERLFNDWQTDQVNFKWEKNSKKIDFLCKISYKLVGALFFRYVLTVSTTQLPKRLWCIKRCSELANMEIVTVLRLEIHVTRNMMLAVLRPGV